VVGEFERESFVFEHGIEEFAGVDERTFLGEGEEVGVVNGGEGRERLDGGERYATDDVGLEEKGVLGVFGKGLV
jgi:hypothetical protein